MKFLKYVLCILSFLHYSCNQPITYQNANSKSNPISSSTSFKSEFKDIIETSRNYVNKINENKNWDTIITEELSESTEGGDLRAFYRDKQLCKLVTRHFGESGKIITEYFIQNDNPIFIYEENHQYNRPIYYSKKVMMEHGDTEYFEEDKSIIKSTRIYYVQQKPILAIINKDSILNIDSLPNEIASQSKTFETYLNKFNLKFRL